MFLCYGPFPKDGEKRAKDTKDKRKTRKKHGERRAKTRKTGRKTAKTLKAVVTEIYYYVNYFAQRQQFCTNMCALQSRKLHTRSCLRSLISYLVVLNRCGHWRVDTCVRRCSLSCIEFDVHFTLHLSVYRKWLKWKLLLCTVVCVLHLRVIVGRVDLISIRSSINVATLVFIVAVVTFLFLQLCLGTLGYAYLPIRSGTGIHL